MNRITLYVTLVAAGSLLAACAALFLLPEGLREHWSWQSTLALLIVAGILQARPIAYNRTSGGHSIHPTEAFVMALFVTAPLYLVPVIVLAASVLQRFVLLREPPLKGLFNTAITTVTAAVGAFTIAGLDHLLPTDGNAAVIAVILAIVFVTMTVSDTLIMFGLFVQTEGLQRAIDHGMTQVYLPASFGVLLVAVVLPYSFTLDRPVQIAAVIVTVLAHLMFRSYAQAVEDRNRAERLIEIGWMLADSSRFDVNLERFLDHITVLFRAKRGVLHLDLLPRDMSHSVEHGSSRMEQGCDPLVLAAARDLPGPYEATAADTSPLALGLTGRHTRVAAPIRYGDQTLGALILEDWYLTGGHQRDSDMRLVTDVARMLGATVASAQQLDEATSTSTESASLRLQLQWLTSHSDVGIVVIGPSGRIETWNRSLEDITGISGPSALGSLWHEQLRPATERDSRAMADALTEETVKQVAFHVGDTGVPLRTAALGATSGHVTLLVQSAMRAVA